MGRRLVLLTSTLGTIPLAGRWAPRRSHTTQLRLRRARPISSSLSTPTLVASTPASSKACASLRRQFLGSTFSCGSAARCSPEYFGIIIIKVHSSRPPSTPPFRRSKPLG
eukprot:scaffold116543_cov28-Tisochrysis_lutea.AAC.1